MNRKILVFKSQWTIGAVFMFFVLGTFQGLSASQKVCSQDFETIEWTQAGIGSEFTGWRDWNDHIAVTNHQPHSGSRCARWNQVFNRTDPITRKQGIGNSLFDYRGPNNAIRNETSDEMYLSFWFRHDDYQNLNTIPAPRKLFWLVEETYNVGSMFIPGQHGTNPIVLDYANGGYEDQWARDNWGYGNMYFDMTGVTPPGTNGEWVHFEMYFNYVEHYCELWIDGQKLYPANAGSNRRYWQVFPGEAALGHIHWDPALDLHFVGIQFGYFDVDRDCTNCQDQEEYYAGFQLDDIEVWDGMPSASPAPTPARPRGVRVR